MYSDLSDAYLRNGQIDEAITLFWNFIEQVNPIVPNAATTSVTSSWSQTLTE